MTKTNKLGIAKAAGAITSSKEALDVHAETISDWPEEVDVAHERSQFLKKLEAFQTACRACRRHTTAIKQQRAIAKHAAAAAKEEHRQQRDRIRTWVGKPGGAAPICMIVGNTLRELSVPAASVGVMITIDSPK